MEPIHRDIMGIFLSHHCYHPAQVRTTQKDAGKGEQNAQEHAAMTSDDDQQDVP